MSITCDTRSSTKILKTGVICAGNLEGSPLGAWSREHLFKLNAARKERWVTREWQRSKSGALYTNGDGLNLVVYPVPDGFGGIVSNLISGWRITAKRVYPDEASAQAAALKAMFAAPPVARARSV